VPAYITWEQYLRNGERLRSNRCTAATPGQPRKGGALLSGLVKCAHCDHRMHVLYGTPGHPRYECVSHLGRGEGRTCQGLVAASLDTVVVEQVLRVLTPAGIELSLRAAEDIEKERARLDAHWRSEIERAGYEARLAQRSYRAVDPENRLVARTLERKWEEALRHEQQVREEYDRFRSSSARRLTSEELGLIRALSADVPALWGAADTPATDRKEIIRTLVERVTVTVRGSTEHVVARIDWVGGTTSEHALLRPVGSLERLADYPRMRGLIKGWLEEGQTMAQIAEGLNREGFRSPSGRLDSSYTPRRAGSLVHRLGLSKKRPAAEALPAGEWWLRDLAAELGVSLSRLQYWVKQGYAHVRKSKAWGQLVVWADADELNRLRRLRDHPRQNRLARYPDELIRPKQRQPHSAKTRQKRSANVTG
jgi:uncharacterized protein YndB with AHSA1/START domain